MIIDNHDVDWLIAPGKIELYPAKHGDSPMESAATVVTTRSHSRPEPTHLPNPAMDKCDSQNWRGKIAGTHRWWVKRTRFSRRIVECPSTRNDGSNSSKLAGVLESYGPHLKSSVAKSDVRKFETWCHTQRPIVLILNYVCRKGVKQNHVLCVCADPWIKGNVMLISSVRTTCSR